MTGKSRSTIGDPYSSSTGRDTSTRATPSTVNVTGSCATRRPGVYRNLVYNGLSRRRKQGKTGNGITVRPSTFAANKDRRRRSRDKGSAVKQWFPDVSTALSGLRHGDGFGRSMHRPSN